MEDLNVVEVGLAAVAVLLPVLFVYLRKIVKNSETKVDDKILAAIEDALAKSKPESE